MGSYIKRTKPIWFILRRHILSQSKNFKLLCKFSNLLNHHKKRPIVLIDLFDGCYSFHLTAEKNKRFTLSLTLYRLEQIDSDKMICPINSIELIVSHHFLTVLSQFSRIELSDREWHSADAAHIDIHSNQKHSIAILCKIEYSV